MGRVLEAEISHSFGNILMNQSRKKGNLCHDNVYISLAQGVQRLNIHFYPV